MKPINNYLNFSQMWKDVREDTLPHIDSIIEEIKTEESKEMIKDFLLNEFLEIEADECVYGQGITYFNFGECYPNGKYQLIVIGYNMIDEYICTFEYFTGEK